MTHPFFHNKNPALQAHLSGLLIACCIFSSSLSPGCTSPPDTNGEVIRFVTWKPNQPQVWDEIIGIFEAEHPGTRVVREIGPHSSTAFHDLLTQKLKNKSADVDVFLMDVIWPPEFAAAGWAEPLDSFFSAEDRDCFLKGALGANTFSGSIYGIPLFIDSGMLYYRADLLERYGLKPPRTWQEMVSHATAIVAMEKKAGRHLSGFSGQFKQYEGLVCNMMEYILSNRGSMLDDDNERTGISLLPAIEAVRFVRDEIIGAISPRGVLTYEEPESLALFVQGRAVFHRNWPYAWEVANNPARSRIAGYVGIAKLPCFPGGESRAALGGWQLGISRFSCKKQKAWAFISFLAGPRVQKMLALKAGLAPTRTALYHDPEILQAYPQFEAMRDVFLTATPRPKSPLYPSLSHVLQRYFSKVLSDPGSNIEAEAQEAGREIDKIVKLAKGI